MGRLSNINTYIRVRGVGRSSRDGTTPTTALGGPKVNPDSVPVRLPFNPFNGAYSMLGKELVDLADRSRRLAAVGCLTSMQVLKLIEELERRNALILKLADRILACHDVLANLAEKRSKRGDRLAADI